LRHPLARVIKPGQVINDITSLQDFIPTFAAALGEPDLVDKVKAGYEIAGKTYKVHLDGVNLLPFLKGEAECPREGFLYWSDDGDLLALRVKQYKIHFKEQTAEGLAAWRVPFADMRVPKIFNLRSDPFEAAETSIKYDQWMINDANFVMYAAQPIVGKWLESFKDFPPRAKSASFGIDQAVEALMPKT
jgi:arylsulfatase A-like enzyme